MIFIGIGDVVMLKKEKKKIKQKLKKVTIVSRIILAIYLILTLIVLGTVISMNVLPIKYLVPLLIGYVVITGLFGLFAFKNNFRNWIKIVADLLFVVLIAISSFGLYYLNSTFDMLDDIKVKDYQLVDYYILVLKDSEMKNIDDLEGYKLGVYESADKIYEKALKKFDKKVEVQKKKYSSYLSEAEALMDKETDAIFTSAVNYSVLTEDVEGFESNVRILGKISIKIDSNVKVKEVDVTKEPFNVYISGNDIYGNIASVSRSDVNIIATVNPNTHKILLTSIPRDFYVQLHGTKGYKDKLTHAGVYGIDMSVKTIEDLLDIDINYYMRVNFTSLMQLVDAIGGVDVVSDYSFRTVNGLNFVKGTNHLNGKRALAFSRERKAFSDGDRQRGKNQQKVLTAILSKMLSSTTLITKYTDILDSLGGSFQTNMPTSKIYNLVNMQLDKMPTWTFESYNLDGKGSSSYTYTYSHQKLYVMEPDENTVKEAMVKIENIEKDKAN